MPQVPGTPSLRHTCRYLTPGFVWEHPGQGAVLAVLTVLTVLAVLAVAVAVQLRLLLIWAHRLGPRLLRSLQRRLPERRA